MGMSLGRGLSCFGMLTLLSGCGIQGLQDQYTVDVTVSEDTRGRRVTMPGAMPTFDLRTDCIPALRENRECVKPTMTYFTEGVVNTEQLVALRNRFQDYLIWRSVQQCERHTAAILSNQSAVNFVLGTITTGLSAFAAIVTAPAAGIMAASAATTSATKSQFNEDFYHQFVGPAVVRKIVSNRNDYYQWMMSRRGTPVEARPVSFVLVDPKSGKPVELKEQPAVLKETMGRGGSGTGVSLGEYSMEAAIADVEEYQSLCSFSRGLASVINPGPTFGDTAPGIAARLSALRAQLEANRVAIDSLGVTNESAKTLLMANANLSMQILILQQRLLTAPTALGGGTPDK